MNISLLDIPIGKVGCITEINCENNLLNRLSDLGVVKNSNITPMFCSAGKNLTAYIVKDSLIAFRKETARNIKVKLR